jgi:hypothetical protein
MVELISGLYKSVTLDSNVDPNYSLGGLTIYLFNLYACVSGAIVKYSISPTTYLSTSVKTLLSGSYTGTELKFVTIVLLSVSVVQGISDGSYLSSTYSYPNYITHDGVGNLYVSDHASSNSGNNIDSVRRLSAAYGNVTTLAGKTGMSSLINVFVINALLLHSVHSSE